LEATVATNEVDTDTGTITVSTRGSDSGTWHEIASHDDVPDAIDVISTCSVLVRRGRLRHRPRHRPAVRVAVLDNTDRIADFFTTTAQ
jgi:hypothetical protein